MNGEDIGQPVAEPRPPSFLDALAPVVVLIVLLTLTIVLFGIDATLGPLQVALLTSATFAGLVALKNGHTVGRPPRRGHRRCHRRRWERSSSCSPSGR